MFRGSNPTATTRAPPCRDSGGAYPGSASQVIGSSARCCWEYPKRPVCVYVTIRFLMPVLLIARFNVKQKYRFGNDVTSRTAVSTSFFLEHMIDDIEDFVLRREECHRNFIKCHSSFNKPLPVDSDLLLRFSRVVGKRLGRIANIEERHMSAVIGSMR